MERHDTRLRSIAGEHPIGRYRHAKHPLEWRGPIGDDSIGHFEEYFAAGALTERGNELSVCSMAEPCCGQAMKRASLLTWPGSGRGINE